MENNETEIETNHEKHHSEKKSKKMSRTTIIAIVVAIILIIAGGLTWLYTGNVSSAKEKVFKVLPLPAAIVNTKFVSAKEALARVELAKQLAESQGMGAVIDPTQTYDQLLESKKITVLVSRERLSVKNEEIDEEYKNIVKQYAAGDEAKFKEELEKTYRMSPEKFKNEVIRQELEQSQLAIWYSKQEGFNKDAYAKAKELQGKLDGGQSFDEVATAYTQDEATKDFAGDSGLVVFNDLLPEFRTELAEVKVGDIKLVPSRYGLHILKVLELNNDGPDGAKQIHLQQIFVKQTGFEEWLKNETAAVKIYKLLKF